MREMSTELLLPTTLALLLLVPAPGPARDTTGGATSAAGPESRGRVIATVNGEPIHFEQLEQLLSAMHSGAAADRRQPPDLDRVVFRLVNDTHHLSTAEGDLATY